MKSKLLRVHRNNKYDKGKRQGKWRNRGSKEKRKGNKYSGDKTKRARDLQKEKLKISQLDKYKERTKN